MMPEIKLAYIESDDECIVLHRFLCLIAQPVLFAPIDPDASMREVVRVRDEGVSLVATIDGEIVGALGLTTAGWWYNPQARYLTDRWFFVYPQLANAGIGSALLAEAAAIAYASNLPLVIQGKLKQRATHIGNGVHFTAPTVLAAPPPPPDPNLHRPAGAH